MVPMIMAYYAISRLYLQYQIVAVYKSEQPTVIQTLFGYVNPYGISDDPLLRKRLYSAGQKFRTFYVMTFL